MEIWEILDENGNRTGKLIKRGSPMKKHEYHLVVHVWIRNNSGQYLITKRTSTKSFPGMWETTVGSAVVGDASLNTALREVKEEIGVDLSPESGKLLYRVKRNYPGIQDFADVWLFNQEVDIDEVIYQPEEVCGAKWVTPEQINTMISQGEYMNTFPYLEDLFKRI
jgi:isopentenyldiphosphate isomerase